MIVIGVLNQEEINEIMFIEKTFVVANRSRFLGEIAHHELSHKEV